MKNSGIWLSSFSTASKYKILVDTQNSVRLYLLILVCLVMATLLYLYFILNELLQGTPLSGSLIVISLLVLALGLCLGNIRRKYWQFVLSDDCMVTLIDKKHYQLQRNCYFCSIGCWLYCYNSVDNINKKIFIFRYDLDDTGYRRLCRAINRTRS